MSFLPAVPADLQGKPKDYLVELVRQLEKELRHRIRQQSDGKTYFGYEAPYVYVDVNGVQYELGTDVLPPGLGTSDLQANGGSIPETDRINTFGASQTINGHLTLGPVGGEGGEIKFAPDTLAGEFIIDVVGEIARFRVEGSPLGWNFHYNIGSIAASGLSQQGQGTINAKGLFTNAPVILNGESWTAPTLQNGWVNYSSTDAYAVAGYRKSASGMVVVKGLIKDGTTSVNTVLFTLPVGYRPAERLVIPTLNNNNAARVDVLSNGEVRILTGAAGWLAINFTFYADQ